jgi:predicted ArsR family transcriptional regulator
MDDPSTLHRALADPSRARLLELLRDAGRVLTVAELAREVGLHTTTARAHLAVLAEAGLVSAAPEPRSTPGRPRLLYTATGTAGPEPTEGGYRLLARILASHLEGTSSDPAAEALAAGERWGAFLVDRPAPYTRTSEPAARAAVLEHLRGLGFDPEVVGDGGIIRLRRCPFLDTARTNETVVCSIHLGLLRGMLAALDAPLEAADLIAFAEPTACHARITPTG